MPLPTRLLLAALAGVAAGAAFEPLRLVYVLPVAVAALTLLLRNVSPGRGFWLGWVFGSAFMLTLLPWLQVIGVDAWIMLSLFEALFYGLLGLGTVAVMRLPAWPVWAAALWVGAEALRAAVPFGGFPWGRLAFATIDTPVAPLLASAGTAGVTFVVALVGTVTAWAALVVRRAPVRALAGVVVTGLLASLGMLPAAVATSKGNLSSVTVAAVQGNVPGEGMDAFSERRVVLDNHVRVTKEYAEQLATSGATRPDLVIWPENSTDIDPFADTTVFADIQAAVDAIGVPVLVGAMVSANNPDEVFNQGIVWKPGSGPAERYAKNHPVPFGEYIPFRDLIAHFFSRLDQIPRDMVPGTAPGLLDIGPATVGDVICFEVAYDGLVRSVVEGGAEMLVVQTNNATYMGTGQIEQQFAIARLRAIETGKFVVVAATNGVSGIIGPDGRVVERAPVRSQHVLTETLTLRPGTTAGIALGPWVEGALTLVAAVAVSVGIGLHRRRRRRLTVPERQPVRTTTGDT